MPSIGFCRSFGMLAIYATIFPFEISQAAEATAQVQPQLLTTKKIEVIGGRSVGATESPWQIALVSSGAINHVDGVFCGGTLIDSHWVLTAAHCLYDSKTCVKLSLQGFYVAYGSTDLGKRVSLVAPAEIQHPKDYDCRKKGNDIALIRLQEYISVGRTIQLPQPTEIATFLVPGSYLLTTGWGLTETNGWKSRELLEVSVPIIDYATCKTHYGLDLPVGTICAGEKGKDACTGDSGGPLYVRKAGDQVVQIGIVSFGDSCGKAKVPGAYTSVSAHLAWIAETRKEKQCTQADIAARIC